MPKKRKRQPRYVYILGRPLWMATRLGVSFISDGKFALCHWGLLVTPLDLNSMIDCLREFNNIKRSKHQNLGTLFELVREGRVNRWRTIQNFGEGDELHTDWTTMTIAYVGTTMSHDDVFEATGDKVFLNLLICSKRLCSDVSQIQWIHNKLSKPGYSFVASHMCV
jgi:hypothetical protein